MCVFVRSTFCSRFFSFFFFISNSIHYPLLTAKYLKKRRAKSKRKRETYVCAITPKIDKYFNAMRCASHIIAAECRILHTNENDICRQTDRQKRRGEGTRANEFWRSVQETPNIRFESDRMLNTRNAMPMSFVNFNIYFTCSIC